MSSPVDPLPLPVEGTSLDQVAVGGAAPVPPPAGLEGAPPPPQGGDIPPDLEGELPPPIPAGAGGRWKRIAIVLGAGFLIGLVVLIWWWNRPHAAPTAHAGDHADLGWVSGVYSIALFTCVVGMFLLYLSHYLKEKLRAPSVLCILAHESGMACLVAASVIVTFELSIHQHELQENKKRQAEMEKNVFQYFFGYEVDKDVMDEVYKSVFASKFIRSDMSITYQFSSFANDKDLLRLRTSIIYHVRNVAREHQDYELEHSLTNINENPMCPDCFTKLTVLRGDHPHHPVIEVSGADFDQKEEAQAPVKVDKAEDGRRRLIKFTKPINVAPGKSLIVKYAHETSRRYSDMTTMITVHPAKDMTVKVCLCDDAVKDLKFIISAAHRTTPGLVSIPGDNVQFHEWKLANAVLPGQGIELYWHKKK